MPEDGPGTERTYPTVEMPEASRLESATRYPSDTRKVESSTLYPSDTRKLVLEENKVATQ